MPLVPLLHVTHHWEAPVSVFSIHVLEAATGSPSKSSLLYTEQAQFPQSLPKRQVALLLAKFDGPPLNSLTDERPLSLALGAQNYTQGAGHNPGTAR